MTDEERLTVLIVRAQFISHEPWVQSFLAFVGRPDIRLQVLANVTTWEDNFDRGDME